MVSYLAKYAQSTFEIIKIGSPTKKQISRENYLFAKNITAKIFIFIGVDDQLTESLIF